MIQTYNSKQLLNLKSPDFFPTLRNGAFYNLTPYYRKKLNISKGLLSIGDYYEQENIFKSLNQKNISLKKYFDLDQQNFITYLSPIDYYKNQPSIAEGTNKEDIVRIYTKSGTRDISNKFYTNMANLMNCDITVQLTETPKGTGKRTKERALEKQKQFLEQLVSERAYKQNQQYIFSSVFGATDPELRQKSLEVALSQKVQGLVILELCQGETIEQRQQQFDLIKNHLQSINLHDNLYTVLSSIGEPLNVLHGAYNNIDFFEAEYPFQLSELGQAWIYNGINGNVDLLKQQKHEFDIKNLENKENNIQKFCKIIKVPKPCLTEEELIQEKEQLQQDEKREFEKKLQNQQKQKEQKKNKTKNENPQEQPAQQNFNIEGQQKQQQSQKQKQIQELDQPQGQDFENQNQSNQNSDEESKTKKRNLNLQKGYRSKKLQNRQKPELFYDDFEILQESGYYDIDNKTMQPPVIQQNCHCYTCLNHTKAYIAHLISMKEMTANVLLTIHNYYQYQNFFSDLKFAIDNDLLSQFINFYIAENTTDKQHEKTSDISNF